MIKKSLVFALGFIAPILLVIGANFAYYMFHEHDLIVKSFFILFICCVCGILSLLHYEEKHER